MRASDSMATMTRFSSDSCRYERHARWSSIARSMLLPQLRALVGVLPPLPPPL